MIQTKQRLDYPILFIILYISNAFYIHSYMKGIIMMGTMLLSALTLYGLRVLSIVIVQKNQNINLRLVFISIIKQEVAKYHSALILYFLGIIFSIVSMIVNNNGLHFYIILWGMMGIGLITLMAIEKDRFTLVYSNLILFLATWSLVTYFLYLMKPEMIAKFPIIINKAGARAYNLGFSVVFPVNQGVVLRNWGMFWEPGAYQTFLVLALFFELFILKRRYKAIISMILYFTIQTTFSTTGIIISNVLIFLYFISIFTPIHEIRIQLKRERFTAVSMLILTITILVLFIIAPQRYSYAAYDKLSEQFSQMVWIKNIKIEPSPPIDISTYEADSISIVDPNTSNESDRIPDNTSNTSRVSAFWFPFKAFLSSPIFGIGYDKLNNMSKIYRYIYNTFTPINFFAECGLLFGLLFNFSYAAIVFSVKKSWWIKFLLIIPLFATISTEQYERNASLYLFLFWGSLLINQHKGQKMGDISLV